MGLVEGESELVSRYNIEYGRLRFTFLFLREYSRLVFFGCFLLSYFVFFGLPRKMYFLDTLFRIYFLSLLSYLLPLSLLPFFPHPLLLLFFFPFFFSSLF